MAKGTRGRRRMASRNCRATPYPMLTCEHHLLHPNEKKSTISMPKKELEDITCSVCMEYPHNAVLLLCSSHDKGCRPYMCGTSSRYSNCLDQYKKAYTKTTSLSPHHPPALTTIGNVLDSLSGWPVEKHGEVAELACPLCRGQVKGWTVVESTREYLNCKKRTCMHENCSFIGAYKELKKHVKSEHPCSKPREVDPDQEQKWRRLEREREREDVISTVTSSMPGAVVFGDYVIERNSYGSDSDDDDEEGFDVGDLGRGNTGGGLDVAGDNSLVNVFLLFHAFGAGGNEGSFGRNENNNEGESDDDDDDGGGGGGGDDGGNDMSLVNRLRRQGVLLGRSGRRRRSSQT
ncbi:hypothetical protein HanRHA438_Chr11g0499141 [Helianthus annuus]|uniref:Zinc finger, RING/FYVE/PHD-type n=2 Tax=Helianthus annuus TaxID=4232 RepID=A0A9K3HNF1_HELAN|nr:uncharacterized protein LOC110877007 [Helianthus annuus]XP_021980869.1 uncharacterized protein LOC110877007 [Helianthus annuus]KAF5781668.1 hypothetical protein HanXRQr2_Chr11g0486441 [Helianthus annuus]KAJ0501251.1 hypothetical protein HanHA300_Chr11g0398641 [Helianthus annuus]KAJ0508998.1 hypothetical protein HanIR_Chr11g0523661 [Helianthus annuus]KAJ0517149.1 hypothetical protein HanHA89_Chr11g0421961 [Helianthus annuus]KAJ0685157.1 hypothetical protein HanLR1_Chr11g0399381 [Helianthus 